MKLELDGLQAIPERDERPTVSSANNQQMPQLDLARITSPENDSEMVPINYQDTESSCSPHKENVSPICVSNVQVKVKSKEVKEKSKSSAVGKRKRSHDDAKSKSVNRSRSNARSSSKAKLSKTSCVHQKSQSFKVKENINPKVKRPNSKSDEEKSRKKSRSRSKSAGRTKTKTSTNTKQKTSQPSPLSRDSFPSNLKRHEADEKQVGDSQARHRFSNERKENNTRHKQSNSG